MDFILKVLYDTLYFAGPILLCTLGGLFAYKANVINIGLEGMMLFGGFIAALVLFYSGYYILAILSTLMMALFLGLLFSYFGITRKANFIITGFAINLLALSVGIYTLALIGSTDINVIGYTRHLPMKVDLFFLRLPIIDDIFNNHPLFTYVAFISLFVVHLLMYHTKFGTYVRVVGENPEAAKAVGISVDKVKYLAIIIGAVMSGLAGINVAIEQLSSYTPDITAGIGFIAIAAIYCGSGSPLKSGAYAILFGLMRALAINLSLRIGAIAGLLEVIPYITIVIVLTAVAVKRIRKSNLRGFAHE